MFDRKHFIDHLHQLNTPEAFNAAAMELFHYQAKANPVYKAFLSHLSLDIEAVQDLTQIPFLPIEFFKTQQVVTGEFESQITFESSGTTGMQTSKHYIRDLDLYLNNALTIFKSFYGEPFEYTIMALLPSYLERENSSLVFMVNELIKRSNNPDSGFYLDDVDAMIQKIASTTKTVLLFGVSFALLDLVEQHTLHWPHVTIIETGGMKGRRKELTREELHQAINMLHPKAIHSEYGMTEILSQAYTTGGQLFSLPSTMRFLVREIHDPLTSSTFGQGALNVIDLANVDSCAFIATQDLAKIHENGEAEILGRLDNSDIRGCNLLVLD